jgi:hypothetical protein
VGGNLQVCLRPYIGSINPNLQHFQFCYLGNWFYSISLYISKAIGSESKGTIQPVDGFVQIAAYALNNALTNKAGKKENTDQQEREAIN